MQEKGACNTDVQCKMQDEAYTTVLKYRYVFKEQLHAALPDQMPSYRTEGTRRSQTNRPRLGPPTREQPTTHRGREPRWASAAGAKTCERIWTRSMRDGHAPGRASMYRFGRRR